jgi:hypothetical protein
MLGFTGMILTEAITGVNTLQAWGLQPLHWAPTVARVVTVLPATLHSVV